MFVLSTVQYLSGLCLTLIQLYKQSLGVIKAVNASPVSTSQSQSQSQLKEEQEYNYMSGLVRCAAEIVNARERAVTSAVFELIESVAALCTPFTDR